MSARTAFNDRKDHWRGAELLLALTVPVDLPQRDGTWAQWGGTQAVDLDDIAEAAQWPPSSSTDLPLFMRCVGAAGIGATWRSIVDGERLRCLADVMTEPLLNSVLAIDPLKLPAPFERPESVEDDRALVDLGRQILLYCLPVFARINEGRNATQSRLALEAGRIFFGQMKSAHV